MLSYDDLSKGQKRYVDLVQQFFPNIVEDISFQQMKEVHKMLYDLRELGKEYRVGFPNWLIQHNRLGEGLYFFPANGVSLPKPVRTIEIDDHLEGQYETLLQRHGFMTV